MHFRIFSTISAHLDSDRQLNPLASVERTEPPRPPRTWPGGTGVPAWEGSLARAERLLPRLTLLHWCFVGSRAAFEEVRFLIPAGVHIMKKKKIKGSR